MPDFPDTKFASQVFGERLRELSDARGSYSQIARDLGINRQQFARYLNGSSRPRDALVRKMAEYFEVETGLFFQSKSVHADGAPPLAQENPVASAMQEGLSLLEQPEIPESELKSGFYMQYKQSFTQPDKIVCMLCKIYRDKSGVTRCKRRYSVKVIRDLPGIRVSHTSVGVFVRNLGALVLFESDAVAGDLVFSAFKPSSIFSLAERVKTGVVMTHGRPGSLGPVAGRHIIERIPDEDSKLGWARRQGFRSLEELPSYIQHHFESPANLVQGVLAVR